MTFLPGLLGGVKLADTAADEDDAGERVCCPVLGEPLDTTLAVALIVAPASDQRPKRALSRGSSCVRVKNSPLGVVAAFKGVGCYTIPAEKQLRVEHRKGATRPLGNSPLVMYATGSTLC